MYIHILPQLINTDMSQVTLLSVSIPELNFKLSGKELVTKNPYPNKIYYVGMRPGRKALIGILLKTENPLNKFTTHYEWDVENVGVVTHVVETYIEDQQYDLVSQDAMTSLGFSGFESRIYKDYAGMAPTHITPTMKTMLKTENSESKDKPKRLPVEEKIIKIGFYGYISYKKDELHVNSIESERLAKSLLFSGRYPLLKDAIIV